jgi:hypothetical protein
MVRIRNRRERGEGQFGCLVGLVVLAIAVLIAYRMIPVKVKTADLRDTIVHEAKSAGLHGDRHIRQSIDYKAKQLGLPVTEDDVIVNRSQGYIKVEVKYTVPVEFPGYTYHWNFHHKAENPVF